MRWIIHSGRLQNLVHLYKVNAVLINTRPWTGPPLYREEVHAYPIDAEADSNHRTEDAVHANHERTGNCEPRQTGSDVIIYSFPLFAAYPLDLTINSTNFPDDYNYSKT